MPSKSLPAEKRKEVERLLRAGKLTQRQIARQTGVSTGTVANIANIIGTAGSRNRKKEEIRKKVHEEVKKGGTFREIGRRLKIPASSVFNHAKELVAVPTPTTTTFPEPYQRDGSEFKIDTPGRWLVLSDLHIPAHNRQAIELAVEQGRREGVAGVLLNGDLMDAHEISDHDKDPSAPRYVREVELGGQFLQWLREQFPNARIVFKHGNHDERMDRYIFNRAPALFGLEAVTLRGLLHLEAVGVETVGDRRVVKIGKLHVVHGHEYKGGGGVNPARWLYLKARSVSMTGHFHRTSEHHAKDISGKYEAAWSTGCLCDLRPLYLPLNEWNHGWAIVEVSTDGGFGVRNMRMLNGKAV